MPLTSPAFPPPHIIVLLETVILLIFNDIFPLTLPNFSTSAEYTNWLVPYFSITFCASSPKVLKAIVVLSALYITLFFPSYIPSKYVNISLSLVHVKFPITLLLSEAEPVIGVYVPVIGEYNVTFAGIVLPSPPP